MPPEHRSLSAEQYDRMWEGLDDFIRYNPGSRHRRRMMRAILAKLAFDSVLDVGCGNGEFLRELMPRLKPGTLVHGAEFSPVVVVENRKRFPDVEFFELDIVKRALDRQYDLVLCSEVIEHLDDQAAACKNLAAMVKPGGYLLLTCPTGRIYQTERHFGHTTHPTSKQVREWAAANAMTVETLVNWGFPVQSLLKWAINVRSDWALERFSTKRYTRGDRLISSIAYALTSFSFNSPLGCQLIVLLRK